jgi:hypothetical protein
MDLANTPCTQKPEPDRHDFPQSINVSPPSCHHRTARAMP